AGRRGLRVDQDRPGASPNGRRCGAHGSCRGADGGGATGSRASRRNGGDTAGGHGGKADAGDDSSWVPHMLPPGNVDYLRLLTGLVEAWMFTRAGGLFAAVGPATGRPRAPGGFNLET